MALPTVTLTGQFSAPDGRSLEGKTLVIRPSTPMLDASDNIIVAAESVRITLDRDGRFSLPVVPSDAAGLVPANVPYEVTEQFGTKRHYAVLITSGTPTIDLSDLAPIGVPPTAPSVYALAFDLAQEIAARSAADSALVPLAQKGAANGVATLDGTGAIPDAQIPASIARDTEVAAAVAALVGSAPDLLNTLAELAAALQADESAATTLSTLVGTKAATTYVDTRDTATLTTATGRAAALALAIGA